MTDEMAERTVVSVAALRRAAEDLMGRAPRGWWGAATAEALAELFGGLGLDVPVARADGRVEWLPETVPTECQCHPPAGGADDDDSAGGGGRARGLGETPGPQELIVGREGEGEVSEDIWEDMRERLMGLTTKQLRQIARDEGISLGYAASRKDATVAEIVSQRRHRAIRGEVVTTGEKVDDYRRFAFSPNGIYGGGRKRVERPASKVFDADGAEARAEAPSEKGAR